MTRIAVFDSGLGSLSIIKPLRKYCHSDIVYFADSENYPYGQKTTTQLRQITSTTIELLKKKFQPDFVIVGSNTPSLLLSELISDTIFGVTPPLKDAAKHTKTKNIAILATKAAVNNKELDNYISSQKLSSKIMIHKIDSSLLVDLVESGKFLDNKKYCKEIIKKVLQKKFSENNIDVATLSSTHLPFLRSMLEKEFPEIIFLDPAEDIATKLSKMIPSNPKKRCFFQIFTSGDPSLFQKKLQRIGIKNKVRSLP